MSKDLEQLEMDTTEERPDSTNGNPVDLKGLMDAQKLAAEYLRRNPDARDRAAAAGVVSLAVEGKKLPIPADVFVWIRLRVTK